MNTYGADGLRASTGVAGQTPTDFLYDYNGSILAHQIWGAFGPQEVWVNGLHFGFINLVGSPVSAVLTQSLTDWLGTERARTDAAGNLQATFCNLPFGDQLTTCAGTDPNPADVTHFTGKERDNATDDVNGVNGLDYFGARHYSSSMGRFMSPDWSSRPNPVPYADLKNPQSLNLYGYVGNNPLSKTDPDGHCDIDGEHHSGLWCFAHALGFVETAREQAAEANRERDLIASKGLILSNGPPLDRNLLNKIPDKDIFAFARQLANEQYDQAFDQAMNSLAAVLGFIPGGGKGSVNVNGGSTTAENALKQAENWLGPNYKEIAPGFIALLMEQGSSE